MRNKSTNINFIVILSVLTLSGVCTLSGCGMANAVSEPLPFASKVNRAARTPDNIEIYKQDNIPQKGYIPIANIGVHGNGYANMKTLENAMKKEAAEIGAELVILTEYQISKDETIGSYGNGLYMSEQIQRPHLYGVGAVYSKVMLGIVTESNGNIKYIIADSPAEKAGLEEGMQILAINGLFFQNNSIMQQEVSIKNPGDTITIEYLDKSQEKQKITITLEAN